MSIEHRSAKSIQKPSFLVQTVRKYGLISRHGTRTFLSGQSGFLRHSSTSRPCREDGLPPFRFLATHRKS